MAARARLRRLTHSYLGDDPNLEAAISTEAKVAGVRMPSGTPRAPGAHAPRRPP